MLAYFCISWLMVIAIDQTRAPRSAEEVQEHWEALRAQMARAVERQLRAVERQVRAAEEEGCEAEIQAASAWPAWPLRTPVEIRLPSPS